MPSSKFHNTGTGLHQFIFMYGIEAKNKAMSTPTAKCEKSDCHLLSSKIMYSGKGMTENLSEPVNILSQLLLIIFTASQYGVLK